MTVHERIELGFERWGHFVFRARWYVIASVLVLTGFLVSFLPQLETDFSGLGYLDKRDPSRVVYEKFREQFGTEGRILIGLNPPEVFDLGFLELLRELHTDIEKEVPHLDEINSLINARHTRGEGDRLIVEDLMEAWPESETDLEKLRERVYANPLYVNTVISESARFTSINVSANTYSSAGAEESELEGFDEDDGRGTLRTGEEEKELLAALESVVNRHRTGDYPIYVIGDMIMKHRLTDTSRRDMTVFSSMTILSIILLLFLLFRRTSATLLPMLVILASVLATLGAMAMLGYPFTATMQILPSFLIAVGICGSVHLLAIVYQNLGRGLEREDAIAAALAHSGLAIVLTSATTAGALGSFASASVAPVAHLGIISPIGVFLALLYTLTLLPALLSLAKLRPPSVGSEVRQRTSDWLVRIGEFGTRRPGFVLGFTGLLLLVAIAGLTRIHFAHNVIRYLPTSDPLRMATELLDEELGGSETLEILVDAGSENGLHDPGLLKNLDRIMGMASDYEGSIAVGKATSIVDVLKETHQALNENRSEFYTVPEARPLVAQELLLFENSGSDDLEDLTDSQFQLARVTLQVPQGDGVDYLHLIEDLEPAFHDVIGEGVELTLTGMSVLSSRVFLQMYTSMANSYLIAFCVITTLMVLLIGRLGLGLLSMVPNLIPVVFVLGAMGWLDVPLNMSTLLIGSIAIGLAVDDTIHFMHKFTRYFEKTRSVSAAVHETLVTTGSAMLITSVVLSTSFMFFVFGYLTSMLTFGFLTASATMMAFFADILIAPALLTLIYGRDAAVEPGAGAA